MNENLLKSIAKLFRTTPHFKGKYRIGITLQKLLNSKNNWATPEFFIQLKNKTELYIDVRSKTHSVPFWTGRRDQKIIDLIQKMAPKNAVIFDVGANIGYYAIPLAHHLKHKNVSVHAFEPVSTNFNSLTKGIERNNLQNFITVNKIALGNSNGEIEILVTEGGNSSNAVISFNDSEFNAGLKKEMVPMTTVDNYIIEKSLTRCDIIKIDIEGAEIFFIQGGMQLIKKFSPVIYGEFNAFFIEKFGFTILDVWKLLEPLGYKAYREDPINKGSFNKTEVKAGIVDVLFLPPHITDIRAWMNK
ncbi:MAG: FkbM family methyltransferase [Vicingaceae bacterium]